MVNRRKLMIGGLASLTLAGFGSYIFLNNESNQPQGEQYEKVLVADLHTHVSTAYLKERDVLLKVLSQGITGLATFQGNDKYLNYNELIQCPEITEVTPGVMARINSQGKTGFIVKVQEVLSSSHVLAIGCRETIDDKLDPRKVIEEVHRQCGVAVLDHPYVTNGTGIQLYRLLTDKEEKFVREELVPMVDELETHNAHNICLVPGFLNMAPANDKAKTLASEVGFKGLANSDAHYLLDQVRIAANLFPEDCTNFEALKHYIKTGTFSPLSGSVSRYNFIKGLAFCILTE